MCVTPLARCKCCCSGGHTDEICAINRAARRPPANESSGDESRTAIRSCAQCSSAPLIHELATANAGPSAARTRRDEPLPRSFPPTSLCSHLHASQGILPLPSPVQSWTRSELLPPDENFGARGRTPLLPQKMCKRPHACIAHCPSMVEHVHFLRCRRSPMRERGRQSFARPRRKLTSRELTRSRNMGRKSESEKNA